MAHRWQLWKASPSKWSEGKIHAMDPSVPGRLLCGKRTNAVPGFFAGGDKPEFATCITCRKVGIGTLFQLALPYLRGER